MVNTTSGVPVGFARVKTILDQALQGWVEKNGQQPDLSGHGATFKWDTKENLLAAVGHGKRLIQPEVRGNGKGAQANLVIDLRAGLPLRMPRNGPFLDDPTIQEIQDWIDADCPD